MTIEMQNAKIKKDNLIIDMYLGGRKNIDIAKELKLSRGYVNGIIADHLKATPNEKILFAPATEPTMSIVELVYYRNELFNFRKGMNNMLKEKRNRVDEELYRLDWLLQNLKRVTT
jgi:hypothetical protein